MEGGHLLRLIAFHYSCHVKRKLILEMLTNKKCFTDSSSTIHRNKFCLAGIVVLFNLSKLFLSANYNLSHMIILLLLKANIVIFPGKHADNLRKFEN